MWVLAKRADGILEQHDKYLTRQAVDLYFSEVVSQMRVQPRTASRIRASLQFYADKEEYSSGDFFEIESESVEQSLVTQVSSFMEGQAEILQDPHSNLPVNGISNEEHLRVMQHILSSPIPGWRSLGTSWNLMTSTFMRCNSFLKLKLSSLVLNSSHGPSVHLNGNEDETILPIIAIIIHPGDMKAGITGANVDPRRAI